MMEGTTLTPDLRAAITKGDSEAVPLLSSRFGSFDGTSIPTKKMLRTESAGQPYQKRVFAQSLEKYAVQVSRGRVNLLTIKQADPPVNSFRRHRDVAAWSFSLRCRERDGLDSTGGY